MMPGAKLCFLTGKDETSKVVTNPYIDFGSYTVHYADGTARLFYQVSPSVNTSGVSVFIMGIKDRKHLPAAYGNRIGRARVTSYCVKLRRLADIDLSVLEIAIHDGIVATEAVAA